LNPWACAPTTAWSTPPARPRPALAGHSAVFELALAGEAARARAAGGWRVTAPLRAPRRFDLVGLSWERGAVRAEVRARRRGGGWSRWVALHPLGEHRPDGERALRGTEPAWTGAADLLQLRLRGSASGLRARFVRAEPTARVAGTLVRRLRARAGASQLGPPPIIPRAEWGADAVPPRGAPGYGSVQLAFVHHTGPPARDYGPGDSAAMVLAFTRYHRDANGWNDLGYNFLVDRYGQVFEGRAGGVDQAVVGAQAQGFNSVSTGIACIGDFTLFAQSEPGMDALARLIAWKLALHGVPPDGAVTVTSAGGDTNRHPAGALVTFARIAGHRDANRTACPGDALYAQLADLRARVAAYTPRATAALSVRVSSAHVRGSQSVEVAGSLGFADGSAPGGAPLTVEFQGAAPGWVPIGSASCADDGAWRASVVLPGTGSVRAVFAGDGVRPRLESAPVPVTVLPALSIALGARRVPAGRAVRVSGTLAPAAPRVECVLERRVGRRWVRVQRKRIAVRGGRYATTVRPRRPGLYRISVGAPGATVRRLLRAVREVSGGVAG
jgi:hypothetical protein